MKQNVLISSITALCLATYAEAGGSFTNEQIEVEIPQVLVEQEPTINRFYANANLGVSIFTVESTLENGESFNDGALDTTGMQLALGLGYRMNTNYLFDINYQYIGLGIASLSNFYASINYEFNEYEFNPSIGLLYGQSTLTWDSDPHLVLIDRDLVSKSPMYGVQVGVRKEMDEHVSFAAKYQFKVLEHELDIRNGRSSITHTNDNTFSLGVQYEF